MTDRAEKKSEVLEIRLPYSTKQDFMARARGEGRTASDIVREFIDLYLTGTARVARQNRWEAATGWLRVQMKPATALLASFAAAGLFTAIVSPAVAHPDLRAAFMAIDRNSDGFATRDELQASRSGEDRAAAILAALDTDGDGRISLAEFEG